MIEQIAITALMIPMVILAVLEIIHYIKNWGEINRRYWGKNKGLPAERLAMLFILLFIVLFFIYTIWDLS